MQIKIHNEGWIYFVISSIVTFLFIIFIPIIGIIFLILTVYIYYFFRDPIRAIPDGDLVVSPADGIITSIAESNPPIKIDTKVSYIKISIFLNIFNVHVNRLPVSGIIKKLIIFMESL